MPATLAAFSSAACHLSRIDDPRFHQVDVLLAQDVEAVIGLVLPSNLLADHAALQPGVRDYPWRLGNFIWFLPMVPVD